MAAWDEAKIFQQIRDYDIQQVGLLSGRPTDSKLVRLAAVRIIKGAAGTVATGQTI
jgi:hypothetical protein